MNPRRDYISMLLALAVLGLSIFLWRQSREIHSLRRALLGRDEREILEQQITAARKREHDLESRLASLRLGGVPVSGDLSASSHQTRPPVLDSRMKAGIAQMMAMHERIEVDARYAALFKKLGLSPEQLRRLKNLLVDKLTTPIDVMTASDQPGGSPAQNQREYQGIVQNLQAETDQEIQSLLGPTAYAQYENYVQTEPQRAVVTQLQLSLSYTDSPLSATQADQLTRILTDSSTASTANPSAGAPTVIGGSVVTDLGLARAQSVLSAEQIQALREIQQEQRAAAQLTQSFSKPPPDNPPPPPP